MILVIWACSAALKLEKSMSTSEDFASEDKAVVVRTKHVLSCHVQEISVTCTPIGPSSYISALHSISVQLVHVSPEKKSAALNRKPDQFAHAAPVQAHHFEPRRFNPHTAPIQR